MRYFYIIFVLHFFVCSQVLAQDKSQNYIQTRTMLNEVGSEYIDNIQYYDGLGRPSINVQKNVALGKHLMILQEYEAGHESRTWLPYVSDSEYIVPELLKQKVPETYSGDTRPFTEPVYEKSPLNRTIGQYGPGVAWKNHPISIEYYINDTNSELSCKRYEVNASGALVQNALYSEEALLVTKTIDEDGRISYVFSDRLNRDVLVRKMADGVCHDTYYVYDMLGNLRFVLPPAYQDEPDLLLYAYLYKYDTHKRCVEAKLPGCESVRYVYDRIGNLMFSQDGVQRECSEWTFFLYDNLQRPVIKGVCKNTNTYLATEMIITCSLNKDAANMIIPTGLESSGYSSNFALLSPIIYEINYYDNYSFLSLSGFLKGSKFHSSTINSTGYKTGSITKLFDEPVSSLYSVTYYDIKGRPVEVISDNHLGGYDVTTTAYTFTGKLSRAEHFHTVPEKPVQTEIYVYTYNNTERLEKVTHQLVGNNPVVLSENTYDELGRLKSKKSHDDERFKCSYAYNIRDWLTSVSGLYFTEQLHYTDGIGIPEYGGNISSMTWRTNTEGISRSYNFEYDKLSRLKAARYRESTGVSSYFSTFYEYNKMGSVTFLKRYGLSSKPDNFTLIDDLILQYNGNQLKSVEDGAFVADPLYNGAFNFVDGAHEAKEFDYNSNGNLVQDLNKKIGIIQYNLLNVPSKIVFKDGKRTDYLYSADGVKRNVKHYTSTPPVIIPFLSVDDLQPGILSANSSNTKSIDYCNNVIYEDGLLSKILIENGYVTLNRDTLIYHYYQKDHQGNNRVVLKQDGTVEEVNHFYPYGGLFGEGLDVDNQVYKFGGKELDRMHGLDWYDFVARPYDPLWGGGFPTIDPHAENYYSWSPYVYCGANPVNIIDPTGMDWYRDSKGDFHWREGHEAIDGYVNIGSTVSIQLGKGAYLNCYQNGGILANQAVDAFDLIQGSSKLQNQFLGKNSVLSEQSKSELFNGLVNNSTDEIGSFIGRNIAFPLLSSWLGGEILAGFTYVESPALQVNLQFTKSSLKNGQRMHKIYKMKDVVNDVAIKECTKVRGVRPDFVDFSTRTIYELKSFNPQSIRIGQKQLLKYKDAYEKQFGGVWKTVLDTY